MKPDFWFLALPFIAAGKGCLPCSQPLGCFGILLVFLWGVSVHYSHQFLIFPAYSQQAQSVVTIIAKCFDSQWTSKGWCMCIIEDWTGCAYQIQYLLFPDSSFSCSILQLVHFAAALDCKSEWTLVRSDIFSSVKLGFHNVAQDLTVLFCCWLHDSMYTWHWPVHTLGPFIPDLWCWCLYV